MGSRAEPVRSIGTDPAAFSEFYRAHVNEVTRFVTRRVADPQLAADLTADVFLAVIEAAEHYRGSFGGPRTWLYGIARNVIAAEFRRSARERRAEGLTALAAPVARARRVPLAAPARLLRLELRRNPMVWMLPLLAVLFWLGVYRPSMANPPFWNVRATVLQHAPLFLGPLLAGATAWAGSRDGRRDLTDLVGVTAVPRWAGQLATWAATTCWAEAVYLGGVAVVYGITAEQARWGGPLWWPVAVGAAGMAACCALGFAAGALLPGRFTAALAAVAAFLALGGGAFALQNNGTYAQIWPLNVQGHLPPDSYGIFYPYLPDLGVTLPALSSGWTTPWLWPDRSPHDRGAAICAALVFAAGLGVITVRGARDSARE